MKAQHRTYLFNIAQTDTPNIGKSLLITLWLSGRKFFMEASIKRSFNLLVLMAFWFFPNAAKAQEFNLPLNNQYLADNPYLISAAFAGIGDCFQVRLNGVSQWVGVKNSPDTQSLSFDGRISDRSGVGAILFNDKNGFTNQRGGQASFAHHLTFSDKDEHYLSLGLSYKFTSFSIDTDEFINAGGDPVVGRRASTFNSNFDVSALWRFKKFWLSLNAANILDKNLTIFDDTEPEKIRNYYAYFGYIYKKHDAADWEWEPSGVVQYFESDNRSITD
ncbi:type IX secretion system membrane protein PorP/SprF, partial [Spongiivirga sp. MCCC 1A20706]|uniref:PorP/SprF family type IX secretion system membrane protein n=1 Tax=Spongiivirga sp. MCCC 1A20706 TaxID=3160963 RepID=UPI003977D13D